MWAEDEARLGLKPIARRVWSLKGQRPRSNGQSKFESPYVFGFAHPATGRTRTLILPKANAGTMTAALADFARWADPDGRKVLVLIVDNAGWHIAGKLAVPANVVLHHLPSCTPELQPVEPLWPLVREALANKAFPTLAASGGAAPRPTGTAGRGHGHREGGGRLPLGRRPRVVTVQRDSV